MNETTPRVVSETRHIDWLAVEGLSPRLCTCGHEHYGRVEVRQGHTAPRWPFSGQAPQWHICEDAECSCRGHRSLPPTPAPRPVAAEQTTPGTGEVGSGE